MNNLTRTLTLGTVLTGLALSTSPALSQERSDRGERARPSAEERTEARQQLWQELGLTPVQTAQMDSIHAAIQSRREALKETAGDGNRETLREEMQTLRQESDAATQRVLTEEQLSRYNELRSEGRKSRGERGGQRGEGRGQRGGRQ